MVARPESRGRSGLQGLPRCADIDQVSESVPPPESSSAGTPGASARREHQRRKTNREQRDRETHPRICGLLLALRQKPWHERAWERGAGGEEQVAASLAKYLEPTVLMLHDRRIPQSRRCSRRPPKGWFTNG
jgi:hypothetical protein